MIKDGKETVKLWDKGRRLFCNIALYRLLIGFSRRIAYKNFGYFSLNFCWLVPTKSFKLFDSGQQLDGSGLRLLSLQFLKGDSCKNDIFRV